MKKNKYIRLLTILISLFYFAGCGNIFNGVLAEANTAKPAVAMATTTKTTTMPAVITAANEPIGKASETTTTKSTTTKTTEKATTVITTTTASKNESVTSNSTTIINEQSSSGSDSYGWKEYLADYEEFMNSYIELLEKQKKNPNDLTLMTDYLKALQKLSEFSEKSNQIQKDLSDDPDAYLEYMATYMRIMKKLSEVK